LKSLRIAWGVLTSVVVLGSVSTAQAAEGFELGARLGYGIPLGKISDQGTNNKLSDNMAGMVPLQLDLGYRVIPSLMVGAYFMYGFGITGGNFADTCDKLTDTSCSMHDMRLGAQVQYHFMPDQSTDPWLGAGIGYEWLTQSIDGGGGKLSTTVNGFEFINLQGGVDFSVAPNFGLGPFLLFSVAQYGEGSVSCSGAATSLCGGGDSVSKDIDKTAMHQWLLLGVRGTFVL
jgi:hypothetical protein